ncbi:FkbM family methyltransferase [bacterium]|nr:FkbM family methyltransferase [bacterium]
MAAAWTKGFGKRIKALFKPSQKKRGDPMEPRVLQTINCHDCDIIPKVDNAGEINRIHNPPFQVMHNGVKVVLGGYHGDWMQRIISSLKGHHEPQEERVFYEILKLIDRKNPVMLELGSFWAYYSLWFRDSFPEGSNYLVEPILKKLNLGRRNFKLNGVSGKFLHGCVGSVYKDPMTFVDWNDEQIEMTQYSVDSIVQQHGLEFIDILHSDIQGAEMDMLKGSEESIAAHKIGYFLISTHGNMHEQCLAFFNEKSLHVIAEHSIKASASADGLIVAQSSAVPHIDSVIITKLV